MRKSRGSKLGFLSLVSWRALALVAVIPACLRPATTPALAATQATSNSFRVHLCTEAPVRLDGPSNAPQSRGCVVTFRQTLTDAAAIRFVGRAEVTRRYLVYAPATLPPGLVPLVFMFPGRSASAESAAFYYTHGRFEALADRDGFVVVYGNGLPNPPIPGEQPSVPKGGFLQGCLLEHAGEGLDVAYVRQIVAQLERELPIDRMRIYATGLSAGGGMSLELALEAPDLVAAIAPVAPVPFHPLGPWLRSCHVRPGYDRVSIAFLAATDDAWVSYAPGGTREFPYASYPGMEETRNVWVTTLGLAGPPEIDVILDTVQGDSFEPDSGRTSSTVERQRYRPGPDGRELWFYKATGMGHWWPSPIQLHPGMWKRFGKTNQDLDFADEAWTFFRRHVHAH